MILYLGNADTGININYVSINYECGSANHLNAVFSNSGSSSNIEEIIAILLNYQNAFTGMRVIGNSGSELYSFPTVNFRIVNITDYCDESEVRHLNFNIENIIPEPNQEGNTEFGE